MLLFFFILNLDKCRCPRDRGRCPRSVLDKGDQQNVQCWEAPGTWLRSTSYCTEPQH